MSTPDRVRAALHEAGHATMSLLVGARVRWLTLEPFGDFLGHCLHGSIRSAGARALVASAGIAAELQQFGAYNQVGASRDLEQLAGFRPDSAGQLKVVHAAREALEDQWAFVAILADQLNRRGAMNGAAVHRLAAMHGVEAVWDDANLRPATERPTWKPVEAGPTPTPGPVIFVSPESLRPDRPDDRPVLHSRRANLLRGIQPFYA